MASPTEDFFAELGRHGQVAMLARATGTVHFDLTGRSGADVWFVSVDKGRVQVTREGTDADCVVRVDGELFDEVVTGHVNPLAAMLRGALVIEGDPELLVLFQRLFPARQRAPESVTAPANGRQP